MLKVGFRVFWNAALNDSSWPMGSVGLCEKARVTVHIILMIRERRDGVSDVADLVSSLNLPFHSPQTSQLGKLPTW